MRFEIQSTGSAVRACDRHNHQYLSHTKAFDLDFSPVHNLDDCRSDTTNLWVSTLLLSIEYYLTGLAMYFCYGIKNSSLECPLESMETKNRDSQQIELSIPQNRIKQTLRPTSDAINRPNGFPAFNTNLSSSEVSDGWNTWND